MNHDAAPKAGAMDHEGMNHEASQEDAMENQAMNHDAHAGHMAMSADKSVKAGSEE